MKAKESITQYLHNFKNLLQQCQAILDVISPQIEILILMRSMPSQYGSII
uniref:Uncharacterized protein n=1 Tax=Physcomitrium patens TaxID=3218 RepID=A0A2K1JTE9_PHYPA|nr:hypothetical protein PHYPA_014577 [Physcomitrium patens]